MENVERPRLQEPKKTTINVTNQVYRSAARLMYTLLQSDAIEYDSDKTPILCDKLIIADSLLNEAINIVKELEDGNSSDPN